MSGSAVYSFVVIVTATTVVLKLVGTVSTKGLHNHSRATMLTRGQKHDIAAGGTVVLDCEFNMDNFSDFDNPIMWEKQQNGEKTLMNIQGSVQEPFAKTRRYDVKIHYNQAPRYRVPLKIQMAAAEDSGNYTCTVKGRKSVVLDKVVHSVHVRVPIKYIFIVLDSNPLEQTSSNDLHRLVSLNLTEGQAVPVRCVSTGGHPAPELTVSVDDRDITSQFETTHVTDVSGPRGLRTVHFRSSCWTPSFTVTSDDHGKFLRCTAHVEGVGYMSTNVSLLVSYAPKINCETVEAAIGQVKVEVRCLVNARPSLLSLYWLIDSNNSVVPSDSDTNIWTLNRDLGDTLLEAVLQIRRVSSTSFRLYTLLAENEFGQTSRIVQLVRKAVTPKWSSTTEISDRYAPVRTLEEPPNPFDQSELRMPDSSNTIYGRQSREFIIIYTTVAVAILGRAMQ